MNRVAIVILNWNGVKDTIACLDSLIHQSYSNHTIVVIDNGSVDNSVDLLQKYIQKPENKDVILIRNTTNLGFAGGVNVGIQWALDKKFDYVALFNNDATANKDWLSFLHEGMKDNKVGIVTGLLLHEDGKTIDSTGEFYSKWGLPFPRNRKENTIFANPNGLVFGATGGATLYRSAMLQDIGLFDSNFFAYYEDVDISFRAQLAGWKIKYISEAIAYHKQGASSNKIPGFAVYQTFKNLPLLFIKNIPSDLLMSIGIRFCFAYLMMYLNSYTRRNGWAATKGSFKATLLSLNALKQRRAIQRDKRVSSSYIKSILWDDLPPNQPGLRKIRRAFTGK